MSSTKKIPTVTIDRSKWRTGGALTDKFFQRLPNSTGQGDTALVNAAGYSCCLGFACDQLSDASSKKLADYVNERKYEYRPSGLDIFIPHLTQKDTEASSYVEWRCTQLAIRAMNINDDPETTPQQKEKKIKKLFAGKINFEFVGEYEQKSNE